MTSPIPLQLPEMMSQDAGANVDHQWDDRQLVQRLRDGDDRAMAEIVATHGPQLLRLIRRLASQPDDAHDLLQEVFLSAWQKAHTFSGNGSLAAWLRQIAINKCRNDYRARLAFSRLVETFAKWLGARQRRTKRTEENLDCAMEQLCPDDRTLLILFYFERMTGEEIGRAMGIRPSTVHMRLHRARTKLRHLIQEQDNAPETQSAPE